MAGRALKSISKDHSDLEIEVIDVVTNPLHAWKAGIRMIPAIKHGNQILAGIILSKAAISSFIEKIRTTPKHL